MSRTNQATKTVKYQPGDDVEYRYETPRASLWVPAMVEKVNLKSVRISYTVFGQDRVLTVCKSQIRPI